MAKLKAKSKQVKNMGAVRIIAGRWRGRRLLVGDSEGLRPSPARLRETLFNWLAPYIAGSHCWDLFAGSGALGIEACSRGAASVLLLEKAPQVAKQLQAQLQMLDDPALQLQQVDALLWLAQPRQAVDLVFLDPPFAQDLLCSVCALLDRQQAIKPGGWVYTESPLNAPDPLVFYPKHWRLHREQHAGQVRGQLLQVIES